MILLWGGCVFFFFFFFFFWGGGLQTRLMDHPIHPFYDMQLKTQSSQIINETLLTLEMEDKIKVKAQRWIIYLLVLKLEMFLISSSWSIINSLLLVKSVSVVLCIVIRKLILTYSVSLRNIQVIKQFFLLKPKEQNS